MKKFLRIAGIVVLVIAVIVVGGVIYFNSTYPKVSPAPDIKVELTKERIEHGKYLADNVAVCIDCHSTRDWTLYSGPVKKGTEGMGGARFGEELGLPGTLYSKNITPAKLKDWTDGEIMRAIISGVNRDGKVLFPLMPYMNYSQMSKEDLYSIIAYIRSLPAIKNDPPESSINFPVSMIIKTVPKDASPKGEPDRNNPLKYGEYLVTIASCSDCHTPASEGKPDMTRFLAGGEEVKLPFGTIRPANITPHKETGIGLWTKEIFIARFKQFASDSSQNIKVGKNEFNTIMPWTQYGKMTEEDLGAIYEYLMSVKPVKNQVNRFTPVKG